MYESPSDLIAKLAVPHHARAAFRALLELGPAALPAARSGLSHPSAAVRYWCCRYLDHFVASEAVDALFEMVDDPDPDVRAASLHALACERCKSGDCRPDPHRALAVAMQRLGSDDDAHVRALAIGVVGEMTHESPAALAAVLQAAAADPSPAVRKKARWYAPGGPIYERRRSKSGRPRPRIAA